MILAHHHSSVASASSFTLTGHNIHARAPDLAGLVLHRLLRELSLRRDGDRLVERRHPSAATASATASPNSIGNTQSSVIQASKRRTAGRSTQGAFWNCSGRYAPAHTQRSRGGELSSVVLSNQGRSSCTGIYRRKRSGQFFPLTHRPAKKQSVTHWQMSLKTNGFYACVIGSGATSPLPLLTTSPAQNCTSAIAMPPDGNSRRASSSSNSCRDRTAGASSRTSCAVQQSHGGKNINSLSRHCRPLSSFGSFNFLSNDPKRFGCPCDRHWSACDWPDCEEKTDERGGR
jgi:hypothetical protein